jgi:glutamate synthase (NADPH/NADH) large chain
LLRRGFGRQVALWHSQQFESDHVLADGRGTQQWWIEVRVQLPLGVLNTCPVGVATQDERLRKHFVGKADYLVNFFNFIAEDIREHLAALGFKKFDDIVGRTDLLTFKPQPDHWKAKNLSLEQILYVPEEVKVNRICHVKEQNHKLEEVLDQELIKVAQPAILEKKKVFFEKEIKNTDRTAGAMLSGVVAKKYGNAGLPEDTINFTFKGSAGQSFGAFLSRGLSFKLEGDANDYMGKGLSGGKIVVVPPKGITYQPEENVIIGNTVLYGATSGEVYINGIAGERFCVRNSGAIAVVEGAGDHCCEYMTGGRTVVLGRTGRNFAAGMSGHAPAAWWWSAPVVCWSMAWKPRAHISTAWPATGPGTACSATSWSTRTTMPGSRST